MNNIQKSLRIGVKSTLESRGEINGIEPLYTKDGAIVHLYLKSPDFGELERLSSKDLKIEIKEWKERRSLNANRYFHLLSDKLADATRMSKPMCKNYLLYTYGQKWRDENGQLIVIKTNAPEKSIMESVDFHAWHTKPAPDGTPMYVLLKHSSDFDSREMSILIDGVIEECKHYGIQTMTPKEIEELKNRWGVEIG